MLRALRALIVRRRRKTLYRRCVTGSSRAIVLRYHSVAPAERVQAYLHAGLAISPQRFREQVELLARRFDVIDLDQLSGRMANGDPPAAAGRLAAVITFDDGYRDNADTAMPILRKMGVPAAFFVTTAPVRDPSRPFWISELWRLVPDETRRRRLTRELAALAGEQRELRMTALAEAAGRRRGEGLEESFCRVEDLQALRRAGMTVGAHTRTHPHLESLPVAEHDAEVAGSRQDLEEWLGEPVRHFAYPNPGGTGAFPPSVRAAVARAGFTTASTSAPGPLHVGADRLLLPRLGVYAGPQERTLFDVLSRLTP